MKTKMLQLKVLFVTFILCLGLPLRSFAEDAGAKGVSNNDRLRVDLYLYFWPAGLDGDVSVGSHSAHTSIKFHDIIHDLEMGATGAFKISKGDWFLLNDLVYMDLSHKTNENIASIPGASVDATLDTHIATDLLAVGRQWQKPFSWNLFIGPRYFYGKLRLDAIGSLGAAHEEAVAVKTEEWVVPTVGAGINLPLSKRLSFNFIADIGAADKSFNWEAIPTFCWKLNNALSAEAGYRLLDIRHKEDGFKIDTLMHGPIIGMKISF